MGKKLSVIIVTYNSSQLINNCLDSIYKYNDIGGDLEVIIVDNNSQDQENLFVNLQLNYPEDIKLIRNPKNGGYGCGNNLGVSHSTADYFIFMNPDIQILNPVFKKLISAFEQNINLGMMGVTFADKSNSFYFKPEYFSVFKALILKIHLHFALFNSQQMYLSGSFLMFEKDAFAESGGFDENIFLFYEEADISNRIQSIGKQIELAKDIEVFHLTHNRPFNIKLADIERDSLEYYLNKYQISTKKIFKTHLLIFKFKFFIANLLNNQSKKQIFKGWIDLIGERLIKFD